MKLTLTVWQRMILSIRLGSTTATVNELRKIWPLLELLELSDEEKATVNLVQDESGALQWDVTKAKRKTIEIENPELGVFLRDYVKKQQNWPAEPRAEMRDLLEQIGA